MSETADRVVVIGGGVIGAACAYYLSRSGRPVTIIEADEFGKGCSHGNCGLVCPSHVLPLAQPGALGKTLKALGQKNSPLSIKFRFDPSLWGWLLRFARRCTHDHMMAAARARQALLASSMPLYHELLESEPLDCEWETRGLLYVYESPAELEQYAATDKLLREAFNESATRYDGDAVRELEPALKPGLAGGWHYEGDTHLRPDRLLSAWRHVLAEKGVQIREQCALKRFIRSNGRARAADTGQGEIAADVFVVATGAWTPLLNRQLGCRIPIQPGKGYSLTMARPSPCPAIPLMFPECKVVVTPLQTEYRLGSMMEFAGYDSSLNPRRLALLKEGASRFLSEPCTEPVQEPWYGWRPMTYDGIPIIDRSPVMDNVWIAAGHNMLGLSMAPATGKLVAELVAGTTPHLDPAPYTVSRF